MKNRDTDVVIDEGMETIGKGMACYPSQNCIAKSRGCAWRA